MAYSSSELSVVIKLSFILLIFSSDQLYALDLVFILLNSPWKNSDLVNFLNHNYIDASDFVIQTLDALLIVDVISTVLRLNLIIANGYIQNVYFFFKVDYSKFILFNLGVFSLKLVLKVPKLQAYFIDLVTLVFNYYIKSFNLLAHYCEPILVLWYLTLHLLP